MDDNLKIDSATEREYRLPLVPILFECHNNIKEGNLHIWARFGNDFVPHMFFFRFIHEDLCLFLLFLFPFLYDTVHPNEDKDLI